MNNYLFGAVYIIEQDYSDDEIIRDLTNMKNVGYNLITLWPIGNAWLAKSSHEYIFDQTIKVMDICNDLKIKCILQLFGQNQAQEFMPDSALTEEMEHYYEEGINLQANNYWSNLNNPVVREYFDNYFKIAINTLKDHPALYGWDVFNEAHFRSDDPFTTEKYQQWLKKKYKNIETLNYLWYRRYSAFSQIKPNKRRTAYSIWSSLLPATDYEKFRSENLTDICQFLMDTAKKYDKRTPIIIDGTSSMIMNSTLLNRNNDEFETAYIPDIYGATFYPKSWGKNYKETPWTLAMYYSIPASAARKANKPYVINELQTHTQSALTPGSEVSPQELVNWIYMCLFNAPILMQLWRWRPFLHGYQVTGRGLTQFDGTPNKRSDAVAKLLDTVNTNIDLFDNFKVVKPTIKIAISYHNRLAFDSLLKWEDSFWQDNAEGWYHLFWEYGLPIEFTNTEKLDEMDFDSPIIVLPAAVQVSKSESEKLVEYVERGGTLIADGRMGTLNEWGEAPKEGIPGKTLSKLFGFVENDVTCNENMVIHDKLFEAPYMSQILDLSDNTEVLYKMENGDPSVIEHKIGKGKAIYFNSFFGLTAKDNVPKEIKDIFTTYVDDTNSIMCEKEKGVHVAYVESESKYGILVINFSDDSSKLVLKNIPITNGKVIKNIMSGEQYTVENKRLEVNLKSDSSQIFVFDK